MDSPIFDSHLQVALVERDHEVQTIAPEAAGEPLTYRVGPGRPVRSSKNSHSGYRVVKRLCSAVCIMNIAWRRRPLNGRLLFLEDDNSSERWAAENPAWAFPSFGDHLRLTSRTRRSSIIGNQRFGS